MVDRKQKQHYWMITSLVTFELKGEVQQSSMNGMVETPFKQISEQVLSNVTQSMLSRLAKETHNDETLKIQGHTFMNIMWLGHMTQEEFHDTQNIPSRKANAH